MTRVEFNCLTHQSHKTHQTVAFSNILAHGSSTDLCICRVSRVFTAAYTIDACIDGFSELWTLECASQCGFLRLLDRLGEREWQRVGSHFRELRLKHAIDKTVCLKENVPVLHWWLTSYFPEKRNVYSSDIFKFSVQYNRLEILEYLKNQDFLLNIDRTKAVTCVFPEIARWLHVNMPGIRMKISLTCCSTEEDFEFTKWALNHRSVYEVSGLMNCINDAAANGSLMQLQWLHENRPERCHSQMLTTVVFNEQLETAKRLLNTYPDAYFDDPTVAWYRPLNTKIHKWLAFEYKWQNMVKHKAWIKASIKMAVEARDSDSLEFFLKIQSGVNCYQAMQRAVDRGDLKMAQMLFPYQAPVSVFCLDFAATHGCLEMIQWLNDQCGSVLCTTKAMNLAAAFNHLDVVKWLHVNRSEGCTTDAMDCAAGGGHQEMVQWLHTHRSEGCTKRAMEKAAGRGHLNIVKWLHANRTEGCGTNAMDEAAELGHMDVVKWLHEHRSEGCSIYAMGSAAAAGYLNIVKFLYENQDECSDEDVIDTAASNGDLDMIRFFHDQRHRNCSDEGMDLAAWHGHFNVVTWIHENDPDLVNFEGLHLVAKKGDLTMLKYLVTNCKCSIDDELLNSIAAAKQFAVLEWLLMYCTSASIAIDSPFLAQN